SIIAHKDNQAVRCIVSISRKRESGSLLTILLGLLDLIGFALGELDELIDTGWTAELVLLSANNPGACLIGPGERDRADAFTRSGVEIVSRLEALKFLRGGTLPVGLDVGSGVLAAGSQVELALGLVLHL